MKLDPTKFLPLTTAEFQILICLAGGERHGYAIMQEVAETTQGKVRLVRARCTARLNDCWSRG